LAALAKPKPKDTAVALLEPTRPEPILPSLYPPESEPPINRRDRVRAKVNFFAAVRTDALGEDLVRCIDMSRGGLSFKTNNHYKEGAIVRIAVLFSPESREAPAIFVPAKVIWQISAESPYRCGVAYVPGAFM
jgi:hypothetical protein